MCIRDRDYPGGFAVVEKGGQLTVVDLRSPFVEKNYSEEEYNLTRDYWKYLYLDRKIYQPGDTVNYWGILSPRFGAKAIDEVTIELYSYSYFRPYYMESDNSAIVEQQVKVDGQTFTGEMGLPILRPGYYSLRVKSGDTVLTSNSFTVETYTKPAYELTIEKDKKAIFTGEKMNFQVKAAFFEGTPVPNLKLKYYIDGREGTVEMCIRDRENGGKQYKIIPQEALKANTVYQLGFDTSGQGRESFSWAFQTKGQFRVLSSLPRRNSTGVPINTGLEIVFSHENFSAEEAAKYFTISPEVKGKFEKHKKTLVFVPETPLPVSYTHLDVYKRQTLGRGGSDTTALALGGALGADKTIIYTDVPGVAWTDPRLVPEVPFLKTIGFEPMYTLAKAGAKVVHLRAVKAAMDFDCPFYIRSTFQDGEGTLVGPMGEDYNGIYGLAVSNDGIREGFSLITIVWSPESKHNSERFLALLKGQGIAVEDTSPVSNGASYLVSVEQTTKAVQCLYDFSLEK